MSTTRSFSSGDRTMIITETGDVDGPSFVLLHGLGMGQRYWSELADRLAETGRVYALDLPGFGDAPEPPEPLDMAASGDFVAHMISEEKLENVVLVGHSMGSQVAVEAAARHPHLVERLVLIAPTVNPHERTAAKQALRMLQDASLSQPRVFAIGAFYYLKAGPRWYIKKLRTMLAHHVEETMPRIVDETLVIRGEKDRLVPRDWADEVVRLIPHARLVEVRGRGHETMITAGEQVARLIAEFAA
ncbi:alpha/beta fold hydrolase [Agromyces atrinae]|uniref:Alpha/beta hydrolase n=1 Tax=Agromyces atrinae TaxID=592376 RepID=A0A4Q2M774_9MICO|nr:alpha/beta hydrolase [Agromyces atrinae]NYD67726.1 pimeloyl-ACP methyl ester carboxylesterase [Agromyces atrinae]RXZ88084.1 alpha/beta hydrolase [Agromyces atrinae]